MLRLWVQSFLSVLLIAVAALAPPRQGEMMALAFGATPAHALLAQPNVRLVGRGRVPGSLVVTAKAIPLSFALAHKILLIRALGGLCSQEDRNAIV